MLQLQNYEKFVKSWSCSELIIDARNTSYKHAYLEYFLQCGT